MDKHPAQRPESNRNPDKTDRLMFKPEFVTFKIEPEEKVFRVLKEHACRYTPSFRAAFNNKLSLKGKRRFTR
jgi:hypothetical protein